MSRRMLAPLSAGLLMIQPLAAGAQVTSFNGRTGTVTPATSDYSCAQVTGCPQLSSVNNWTAAQTISASTNALSIYVPNNTNALIVRNTGLGNKFSVIYPVASGTDNDLAIWSGAGNSYAGDVAKFKGNGSVQFNNYGAGTLTTDSSGVIIAASPTTERSNLGLGTAATQNTSTSGANVPLLNGTNTWSSAQTFSTAPVFGDPSGSRSALGLGSAATQNTGTSGANVPLMSTSNIWGATQIGCFPASGGCSSPKIGAVFDAIGPLVGTYPGGLAENNQFDAVAYNGFSQFQAERRNWDPSTMQFKQVLANEVVGSFLGAAYDNVGSDPSDAGMILYATEDQVHDTHNGMGLDLDYTPNGSTALSRGLSVSPGGNGGVVVGGGFAGATRTGPTDMGQGTLHAASDIITDSHLRSGGAAPALSTCGTGSTINGTDVSGKVSNGSAITACTVTFAHGLNNPTCIVQDYATATPAPFLASLSGSGFTVNWSSSYGGSWFYICLDH